MILLHGLRYLRQGSAIWLTKFLFVLVPLSAQAQNSPPEPILLNPIAPFYPQQAFDAKQEGAVRVGFDITADGKTTNYKVLAATPPKMFDGAALRLVAHSRYAPATVSGLKQQSTGLIRTIEFKLSNALLAPKSVGHSGRPLPFALWNAEFVGFCALDFMVQVDGSVSNVKIMRSQPYEKLDEACLENIEHTTFTPAQYSGNPVAVPFDVKLVMGIHRDPHFYLTPGQWVTLDYTLQSDGNTADVEVVDKSDEHTNTINAIRQLRQIHFMPETENGQAVEKRHQRVTIGTMETSIPPLSQW